MSTSAWCSHDLPMTEGDVGQTYRLPFVKVGSSYPGLAVLLQRHD